MTHAHTVSSRSNPIRTSRAVPIGEFRMGGMPQPARRASSRWMGVGLVAVLTGIGGVSAYHVMSSNHPELVSVAPHAPATTESVPESAPETKSGTAPAPTPAPTQVETPAEPPRVVPVIERPRPAPTQDKPVPKPAPDKPAPAKPAADKPGSPASEISPPTQMAAPTGAAPAPAKVDVAKPDSSRTDAAPATTAGEEKPIISDRVPPKPLIDT